MQRHHIARIYWGTFFALLGIVIISVLQVATTLNPVGVVFDNIHDATGININYNIPSYFDLFPPLDVVNAPTISCLLTTGFIGVAADGTQFALSAPSTTIIPTHTFDLSSSSTGRTFDSFIVREGLTCPVVATNFPPNLVSGTTSITWTGTKKDGTQATILADTESIVLQKKDGTVIPLPSGTVPLSSVYIYQWKISKSQIESAIGVNPLGDNFNSLQNIGVTSSLKFYQGNVPSIPWTVTNVGPSQVSYTLRETTGNPVAINNLDMQIKVISPPDATINPLQNTNIAKIQVAITNWTTGCGGNQCNAPQISLYFTDPTSTNKNIPIYSSYLTPDAASGPNNGVTTFSLSYPFGQNTKAGQYTFVASMTGNPTVGKANVYVKPVSPPTCPTGQYFDSTMQVCKSTATKQCSDGSVISANFQCPAPLPNGQPPSAPQCTASQILVNGQCQTISLPYIPWQQLVGAALGSGQQSVQLLMFFGVAFVLFLIGSAAFHSHQKRNDGEGIPSITETIPLEGGR